MIVLKRGSKISASLFSLWLVCALLVPPSLLEAQQVTEGLPGYTKVPSNISSNGGGDAVQISVSSGDTRVTRVTASGSAYNSVTFSIKGGPDSRQFVIDPFSGVLSFVAVQDRYNPVDTNRDNVYEVSVAATDSAGSTDVQNIFAIVLNGLVERTAAQETQNQIVVGTACGDLRLSGFTPHIYNSQLHSFDFQIQGSNAPQVQMISVGGYSIPLRYVTTRSSTGGVVTHVDVPDQGVSGNIQVTVSSGNIQGSVPCVVSSTLASALHSESPAPSITTGTPSTGSAKSNTSDDKKAPTTAGSSKGAASGEKDGGGKLPTTTATGTSAEGAEKCSSTVNRNVWIALIIADILFLFAISRFQTSAWANQKTLLIIAAVASFIVLAALWYFWDECRSSVWFPGAIVVIGCIAILSTLLGDEVVTLPQIPPRKK